MVKPLLKENKDLTSKNFLNTPKYGFIQKKKNQKFKQTPTGKVSLINRSKMPNNNSMENNTPQKMDTKLKKKDIKKQEESTKKQFKKKNSIEAEENESDLDDVNEGIVLQNSITENSDETQSSDDSESEEETLPNILGTSLADESDDDDEDYEDDKKVQTKDKYKKNTKKGLKMFDGVKSNKSTDYIDDVEDFTTDDSDDKDNTDSDDDSDDDSYEDSSYGDSSYDEEDEELGEGEEDEESKSEEEDEESESEDEANESLGLKVLLGNSIADDDDDDDDFVEPTDNDEDDDISDEEDEESEEEKVEKNNSINNSDVEHSLEDLKKDKRTIFVNNLPKNVTKKKVEKLFKKFGKIDTIRLRGKIPKSLNISKRTAAITNDLHSKLKTIYAFVKFESEESVKKASSLNGKIFEGNYLEVRASHKSDNEYDPKKAVFIGNLHFNIDINTIRNHFKQCGEIESVRIVQDKDSRVGKGFGYVNFKSEDAVALALELNGTTILNREVRVKPYIDQHKNKERKHGKRSHSAEDNRSSLHKKSKNAEVPVEVHSKENAKKEIMKQKLERREINPQEGNKFQGQKADGNQKKRKNKLDKKKKFLAEKLMAKPKKPLN
ncbi:nucleolar protein 12-like isoform X2 [Frieseomelitta varia]|nr:nucleolar protein 12-like isoform X2 [Frieseomelitta varia]